MSSSFAYRFRNQFLLFTLWLAIVSSAVATAQAPLKRSASGEPPVILLNGYQLICSASPVDSSDTFGRLEALLVDSGRQVRFFDNCLQGRVSIARLGQNLRDYLAALRYDDGTPVDQVDLIGHSMGGLIARCYLAGCTEDPAVFEPPVPKRVRKVITIGTPHFGADFGISAPDLQAALMVPGNAFLFGLATWNQFREDWRGVDVLAIAGRSQNRPGDGLVSALSASSYFSFGVPEDRTRVIVGCHTGGFAGIFLGCAGSERAIANIPAADHPSWQLIRGFLTGDLKPELFSAVDDREFAGQAGFWLTYRTAEDELAAAPSGKLGTVALDKLPNNSPVAFLLRTPQVTAAALDLTVNGQPVASSPVVTLGRGVKTLPLKQGVSIAAVDMESAAEGLYNGRGRVLVSGGMVLISGAQLASTTDVLLDDIALAGWSLTEDGRIMVMIPSRPPGAAILRIRTSEAGQHAIRVVFGPEPARLDTSEFPSLLRWNAVEGATGYALWIGTEAGKSDLLETPLSAELTAANLPTFTAGSLVYLRLWTRHDGDWYYRDTKLEISSDSGN